MTTPRIDAHVHLWTRSPLPGWIDPSSMPALDGDFTVDDLTVVTATTGTAAAVVVQAVADVEETTRHLAAAALDPVIAGVVGWVDLTAESVGDTLDALRDGPGGEHLVGIRSMVQSEPDPDWLDRRDVRRGLTAVAERDLAFDLLVAPPQLPAAVRTAQAMPGLRFVLDHLGKPPIADGDLGPWSVGLRGLARLDHVTAKLSGLVSEADWQNWTPADLRPAVDAAVDGFGPQRLMWGSDWPVCRLATTPQAWSAVATDLTSALSPGEQSALRGGTAIRTYSLTHPVPA